MKQRFTIKWEYYNFGETKEFIGIHISYNYKNQKIFVDQSEYLSKVLVYFNVATNPTSAPLLLDYILEPNDKQYDINFYQEY